MALNSKRDFQALMFRLLDPLKPYYSKSGARLHLGDTGVTYDSAAIEMEAFSRPLWALVPYWLGGGDKAGDFAAIYQKGLAAGTDPENPAYWGDPKDHDQRFVEMAALACAILETPETLWEPLPDTAKKNLAAWLDTINHHALPGCNWLFFMVLVNLALHSVGMPCDMDNAARALDEFDTWYVGDGWYSDGPAESKPQKDYYVPWAIAYYSVLYSRFAADSDPVRAARLAERGLAFGRQFAYWFDENGAALPYGRSLTSRFGQCAFYSVCLFAGLEPLPIPVMKGIIVRNMEWWLGQKIFDRDGVLTIGYCYPQMYMAERYNAPGSPYWGLKSFILLALPDDHPFWTAEAAPLPVDAMAPLKYMPSADMLMQRLPDGQLNAYVAGVVEKVGHGQFPEKYSKFVYNTRFGFSASRSQMELCQAAPDSTLAFMVGGYVMVRRYSEEYTVTPDRIVAQWSPFPGITVTSETVPCAGGHTRRHTIESSIACTAYDCGFAVPKFAPGFAEHTGGSTATAENDALACTVSGSGTGVTIKADPNTNLYDPNTVIPAMRSEIPVGTTILETKIVSRVK